MRRKLSSNSKPAEAGRLKVGGSIPDASQQQFHQEDQRSG